MAYPTDKETFNRVINQDLGAGIPGSTLDQGDHNLPADFLERLQDTLGLEVQGAAATVADRISSLENLLGLKFWKVVDFADINYTSAGFPKIFVTTGYTAEIGDTIFIIGGADMVSSAFPADVSVDVKTKIGITETSLGWNSRMEIINAAGKKRHLLGSKTKVLSSAGDFSIGLVSGGASGNGSLYSPSFLFLVF